MSRWERIEELLADVLPRLEKLKAEALAEIEKARQDAREKVSRYEEAREELEGIEARLEMLHAERESLPVEHSRATLADDVDEELRIKARFAEVEEEIVELEDRRAALRGEMDRLLPPRSAGRESHKNDLGIHYSAQVTGAAYSERAVLEEFKERLAKAIDEAVGPVVEVHDKSRAFTESLSRERSWDQSPVGRGAIRG